MQSAARILAVSCGDDRQLDSVAVRSCRDQDGDHPSGTKAVDQPLQQNHEQMHRCVFGVGEIWFEMLYDGSSVKQAICSSTRQNRDEGMDFKR